MLIESIFDKNGPKNNLIIRKPSIGLALLKTWNSQRHRKIYRAREIWEEVRLQNLEVQCKKKKFQKVFLVSLNVIENCRTVQDSLNVYHVLNRINALSSGTLNEIIFLALSIIKKR